MSADTKVRALRGAITVQGDGEAEILEATRTLLSEMVVLNSLEAEQLVSVIFTATPDLTAAFPARAARELGWNDVPLLCMIEMAVPGSLPRCVRVLMHAELPLEAGRGRHVYLGGAAGLRPDISGDPASRSAVPSLRSGSRQAVIRAEAGSVVPGEASPDVAEEAGRFVPAEASPVIPAKAGRFVPAEASPVIPAEAGIHFARNEHGSPFPRG